MPPRPEAKHWCFTLNNPTLFPDEVIEAFGGTYAYLIFQLEQGAQGTPHYQGYVYFEKKQRLSALTPVFGNQAHWEICRGTPTQNRAYCTKPDGRIGEPCESGLFPENEPGRRTDLELLHSRLQQNEKLNAKEYASEFFSLFARYPDLPERFYAASWSAPRKETENFRSWCLYGPPGTGKSRLALYLARGIGGGEPYRHSNTKWFDGYRGERTIIFDDFCGSSLSFTTFKRVVDRYPFRVELKGSSCEMVATNFIFTTNVDPKKWWKDEVTLGNHDAIFRRIGKVLWFRAENHYSLYPDYPNFARTVLTPRGDGENQVETPIQEILYPEGQAPVLPQEVLL